MERVLRWVTIVTICLICPVGGAQGKKATPEERAQAEALYEEGVGLQETDRLDEAAERFRAAIEIDEQLKALPPAERTWVFVSASSCGTYAGLAVGFSLLGRSDVRLVGVSPDVDTEEIEQVTQDLCQGTAALLGTTDALPPDLLISTDEYIGDGYGIPTEGSTEATSLLARTEGVLLDPVYTAKTAAGMLDWARKNKVPQGDRLVLWHTGGYPSAFV